LKPKIHSFFDQKNSNKSTFLWYSGGVGGNGMQARLFSALIFTISVLLATINLFYPSFLSTFVIATGIFAAYTLVKFDG
jgi:hypothetical protein